MARLYYDKGGKSKWLGALVQLAGFPILLPSYFFPTKRKYPTTNINTSTTTESKEPSTLILASIYVSLDLQIALRCLLHSFTPYIVNALVLLTISSTLLVLQGDSTDDSSGGSKAKYPNGFICTLGASAECSLTLSLSQLASSLFSNAINVVGLPVVPVVAVIFFHDKMDGIKAMALFLAIWGLISYVYQHYLDDPKSKIENKNGNS
ncbi:hypothetical protein ACFX13_004815 [Malus domestica]